MDDLSGNTDISSFARQEDSSAFTRFSTRTDDAGNLFTNNMLNNISYFR